MGQLLDARPLLEAAAEFYTLAHTPIDASNEQKVAEQRSAAYVKLKRAALDGVALAALELLGASD